MSHRKTCKYSRTVDKIYTLETLPIGINVDIESYVSNSNVTGIKTRSVDKSDLFTIG